MTDFNEFVEAPINNSYNGRRTASITAARYSLSLPCFSIRKKFCFFFCRCLFYRFYHHPYLRHHFITMPKYHSFRVDHRDKVRLTRCQTKSFFYSWVRHTSSECNHLPADIASIISDYTRYFDNLCSLFLWCFRLIFLRYLALFCGRRYFSSFQLLRLCSVCIPYFLYLHFFSHSPHCLGA